MSTITRYEILIADEFRVVFHVDHAVADQHWDDWLAGMPAEKSRKWLDHYRSKPHAVLHMIAAQALRAHVHGWRDDCMGVHIVSADPFEVEALPVRFVSIDDFPHGAEVLPAPPIPDFLRKDQP